MDTEQKTSKIELEAIVEVYHLLRMRYAEVELSDSEWKLLHGMFKGMQIPLSRKGKFVRYKEGFVPIDMLTSRKIVFSIYMILLSAGTGWLLTFLMSYININSNSSNIWIVFGSAIYLAIAAVLYALETVK